MDSFDLNIKNFLKKSDNERLTILLDLEQKEMSLELGEFFLQILEQDYYDRVRIKTAMILEKTSYEEITQKLRIIYSFERENTVKLAIMGTLAKLNFSDKNELFETYAKNEENDLLRATAIRLTHENLKFSEDKMQTLLLDVIRRDRSFSPKEMALKLLPSYCKGVDIEELRKQYSRETDYKIKKLLREIALEIAEVTKIEVDFPELEVEERRKQQVKKRRFRYF